MQCYVWGPERNITFTGRKKEGEKNNTERQIVKYLYFPKLNFPKYILNGVFH